MEITNQHTAIIYDLNVLSSLLGRYYSKSKNSFSKLNTYVSSWTHFLLKEHKNKPLVPKNDRHSIFLFRNTLENIKQQLSTKSIDTSLKKETYKVLQKLSEVAATQKTDNMFLVSPEEIGKSLGLNNLWALGESSYKKEFEIFKLYNTHPIISDNLNKVISVEEIKRWLEFVCKDILKTSLKIKNLIIYKSKYYQKRHLMWSINDTNTEYCIPNFLTYGHFFSWDCPHNIAHLLHLSAISEKGILGYTDNLLERSYFEGVAVYSEYLMYQFLINNEAIQGNKELRNWLLLDRGHEFLLRLVRLMADLYSLQGMDFETIVDKLHKKTKLSCEVITNEVNRYYALVGLGSVYTVGYLVHKKNNRSFDETIIGVDNIKITEW